MVKIVHTSDLHLDASYAFLTGKKLSERREDFLNSLDKVLEFSAEREADLIIISGDFFDKVNPTNYSIYYALKSIKSFLEENDCKILIVSGNHDEPKAVSSSKSPVKTLNILDDVIVSTGDEDLKEYQIKHKNKSVGIYLKGYDGLNPTQNPMNEFPKGDHATNIAVLHGSLTKARTLYSTFKDYSPFSPDDCEGKNYDYYALGHLHQKQTVLNRDEIFAYPGSPARYSFKESDIEKGLFFLDFDKEINEDNVQFHELPTRDLVVKEIMLDKSMDDINEHVIDEISESDSSKLLNIKLKGEILFDSYKNIKLSEIRKSLEDNWFEIKIDKGFQVHDPHADYEFQDLKKIGPVKEFKRKIEENIETAKKEDNDDLLAKYEWMYDKGLDILTELGES